MFPVHLHGSLRAWATVNRVHTNTGLTPSERAPVFTAQLLFLFSSCEPACFQSSCSQTRPCPACLMCFSFFSSLQSLQIRKCMCSRSNNCHISYKSLREDLTESIRRILYHGIGQWGTKIALKLKITKICVTSTQKWNSFSGCRSVLPSPVFLPTLPTFGIESCHVVQCSQKFIMFLPVHCVLRLTGMSHHTCLYSLSLVRLFVQNRFVSTNNQKLLCLYKITPSALITSHC